DLLSLAAHKLQGPPGAAALYVRRRLRLVPLVHGGHQERSRRAGTENLPAIVGFGAAAERAAARIAAAEPERIGRLGARLETGLLSALPDARRNGEPSLRIPGLVNVCFSGLDEEAGASAVMALERIPARIRREGGVARMSDPRLIKEIESAVSIPVMAKCRIGHTAEARILEALGIDFIDESEVLTPADEEHHVD